MIFDLVTCYPVVSQILSRVFKEIVFPGWRKLLFRSCVSSLKERKRDMSKREECFVFFELGESFVCRIVNYLGQTVPGPFCRIKN